MYWISPRVKMTTSKESMGYPTMVKITTVAIFPQSEDEREYQ
ncbi:hypothetical protein Xenpb_03880 [Xenorhabdus sp. PB62.4]|nr:hypothetical protein [Xenorhabdus sp. PB62.4]